VAITIDAIVDRVRSLCVNSPFEFAEAVSSEDFLLQPTGRGDQVFKVKARGGQARGQMGYVEERTDLLEIDVIRSIDADYDQTRRGLLQDATSLTAAILRDGHVSSGGEYTVPDEGRLSSVVGQKGASFLTLRLTVPVNYETTV
jgi:hypothetical protein